MEKVHCTNLWESRAVRIGNLHNFRAANRNLLEICTKADWWKIGGLVFRRSRWSEKSDLITWQSETSCRSIRFARSAAMFLIEMNCEINWWLRREFLCHILGNEEEFAGLWLLPGELCNFMILERFNNHLRHAKSSHFTVKRLWSAPGW